MVQYACDLNAAFESYYDGLTRMVYVLELRVWSPPNHYIVQYVLLSARAKTIADQ
jgi:hypothetical protein